jgi:hypothetical protein
MPLGLLAHFARRFLEILRRFVHACGAEMLNGLREMAEAGMEFGVLAGGTPAAFA